MIDIDYSTHPTLYHDYEACLEFLRGINANEYPLPDDVVNFHVYSDMKSPKEALCIKSYLATQDLKATKLILWSDMDLSNNKFVAPFKDLIELRAYRPHEEAVGTLMEGRQLLNAKDEKHYLQSDLMRILVCHKYGGVFIDMDIVLLRDFRPLLDQEYMYMWGSETDFRKEGACATVLSCHKQSEFSTRLLHAITESPAQGGTTCWGKDMFARMYREKPFPVLPSTFFNTEWCINVKYKGKANEIQATWFDAPIKDDTHLFVEAFAWHWHNTSWRHKKPKEGSKFHLLESLVDRKLTELGILKHATMN